MTNQNLSRPDHFDQPFQAIAHGSVVVVMGVDAVAVSMTPEAILASLEPLRLAAEEALENRDNGIEPEL